VLARDLWREALIVVYRLLFIFKLEASPDPARVFSFNTATLWRNTFSPSMALARFARLALEGHQTGSILEKGLRALFAMFADGLRCTELSVSPLDGVLFGRTSTRLIDDLVWGELAIANLLDRLLWTQAEGNKERMRVHYGPLDVEDLGRIYEALLELEPGLATEAMIRLRRDKLEVVVPKSHGEKYRASTKKGSETAVEFVEDIPEGRFFLRVGLGRKATGSYYTPHALVRFLVQETLGPLVAERSPKADPQPIKILELRVIDPAMGSGHFLVEACRFLGEKLYEACRLCDELASGEEEKATQAKSEDVRRFAQERATELRRRVQILPDPNHEILAYLPSRILKGEGTDLSQARALALCRRLLAVHSLYGVDKNPLAVELAKVTLWLESFAEGLPLTFLDHRLVCGDSLTGPFVADLLRDPATGTPVHGLFAQGLHEHLRTAVGDARASVKDLEASIGISVADVQRKYVAKKRLDDALAVFKQLAVHWTQAASRSSSMVNGRPWEEVLRSLDGGALATKFGCDALAFDIAFPEVFASDRRGFDVVLGNPPWDAVQPLAKEFFAAFDLEVLDAPTRLERERVEERVLALPGVRSRYEQYLAEFERTKQVAGSLYSYVGLDAGLKPSGAVLDVWQLFAERGQALLRDGGRLGLVLPSAFHANASATGIRHLFLEKSQLEACFSFENSKKLFDIHASFKFASIVAKRSEEPTREFRCAFYLHDLEWLFEQPGALRYTLDFVRKTSGEHMTFLELRTESDVDVATLCFRKATPLGRWLRERAMRLGEEIHMAKGAKEFFTPIDSVLHGGEDPRDPHVAEQLRDNGYLPLHEGKTFHQYTDHWEERPRYVVALDKLTDKQGWLEAAQFYRVAFRDIASSTNERTGIFCFLPPGVLCGNTAPCEREPAHRANSEALLLLALANSFTFDWNLRQKSAAHVNLFILKSVPVPKLSENHERFLIHGALRLSSNHDGYSRLWTEQVPTVPVPEYPSLGQGEARRRVRAAIDAVIAHAYGLSRPLYEHVLDGFSHASDSEMRERCLGAFDELAALGLTAFAKRHDPFDMREIPRSVALPQLRFAVPAGVQALEVQVSEVPKRAAKRR
jgi:hypothetical protein